MRAVLKHGKVSGGRPEVFEQSLDRRRFVREVLAHVKGRDGLENSLDLFIGELEVHIDRPFLSIVTFSHGIQVKFVTPCTMSVQGFSTCLL